MPRRANASAPRARSPITEVYLDEIYDDLVVADLDEELGEGEAPADLEGERTRTEASSGELAELRTWERLVDLAECAGKPTLADAFRTALDEER